MEQYEVVITENPFEIVFLEDNFEVVVQNDEVEILSIAEQGPAGINGGNPTFVQESEPISGMIEGSFWFNPVTMVTKIYASGAWELQAFDDGFF